MTTSTMPAANPQSHKSLEVLARIKLGDNVPMLTVNVTPRVLSCAVREHAGKCMVAQAIRFLGSDVTSVNVTADSVRFNYAGKRFIFNMPANGRARIIDFDNGVPIKPFVLRLRNGLCGHTVTKPAEWVANSVAAKKANKANKLNKSSGRKHIIGARTCIRRYGGLKVVFEKPTKPT